MNDAFQIAVFASGAGTTLQTLIDSQERYGYRVALVVVNRECMAAERAATANIPTLQTKDWNAINDSLRAHDIQLIVLAGFSLEMFLTAKYETAKDIKIIKAVTYMKFMLHAGSHEGSL